MLTIGRMSSRLRSLAPASLFALTLLLVANLIGPPSRRGAASTTGANANAIATSAVVHTLFRFFMLLNFLSLFWPSVNSRHCRLRRGYGVPRRTHFRPFTEVMRKTRREVTRKMQKTCRPRITRLRQGYGGQAADVTELD